MLLSNGIEVYGIIYKIENMINNKVYIGQTSREGGFDVRYYGGNIGKYTTNKHLKNSIEKYGIENFKIDKEWDYALSKFDLDMKEMFWIEHYGGHESSTTYNEKEGGARGSISEAHRAILSKANKGKTLSEEHKAIIREIGKANKGRILSEETRVKIGVGNKGKIISQEQRQKISESLKGKTYTKKPKARLHKAIICAELHKVFKTTEEVGEYLGCHRTYVGRCMKQDKQVKGYTFKYIYCIELYK